MAEFTEYQPGTMCWIDLQTSDVDGAVRFYRSLFGWDRQDLGAEAGGYGFFLKNGKMVAGVGPTMEANAPIAWSTYVTVEDVDATTAKARESGGTVVAGPMDVMEAGRMAMVIDPAGAAIGLWQPGQHKGAELANEDGTWGWSECQSRNLDATTRFYADVFGWKASPFGDDGNYVIFEADGRSIGGTMTMPQEVPAEVPSYWLTYFGVEDADRAAATVQEQGGQVLVPPTDVPGVGRFAMVTDPQGATFAVIKPAEQSEG